MVRSDEAVLSSARGKGNIRYARVGAFASCNPSSSLVCFLLGGPGDGGGVCVRARGVGGLGQLLGDEQHPEGEAVGAAVEAAGDARMKAGKLLAAGAMANDFE